jgi:RND family efflux transporter MFP subunit
MKTLATIGITAFVSLIAFAILFALFVVPLVRGPTGDTVVRIEKPQRGTLVESVSAPGVIEPVKKVAIRARISAQIEGLPYKEGDLVSKGDPKATPPVPASVLLRLDDRAPRADLRSAQARSQGQQVQIEVAAVEIETRKAEIVGIEVNLAQAERDLGRQQGLLTTKDVSQSTVDKTQSEVDELRTQLAAARHRLKAAELAHSIAQHSLEAAEADMERARESLGYTVVESPIDGVVTQVPAEVGEMATGSLYNPGTLIIEVADLTRMLVKTEVDEADIGRVKAGQSARVRIQAWPEELFTGVVSTTALASATDRQGTTYFPVEIVLENKDQRILSGLNADVEIEIETHPDVLKIPSQAVLSREVDSLPVAVRDASPDVATKKTFATVVFRAIDRKAVITPVKIGRSDSTHTILLSGVTENDAAIVGPYKVLEKLAHDQKIIDEREKAAAENAKGVTGAAGAGAGAGAAKPAEKAAP